MELDARVPLPGAEPAELATTAAEGDEPSADRLAVELAGRVASAGPGDRPRSPGHRRDRCPGAGGRAFFAVRAHARELYTYQMNAFRIERPEAGRPRPGAAPTTERRTATTPRWPSPHRGRPTIEVDERAEPPDLDIDSWRDRVVAEAAAEGDEPWRIRVVASDRRRFLARVPAPALGWSAVRVVAATPRPDTDPVLVTGRSISNGRFTVEVAEDGRLTLSGGGAGSRVSAGSSTAATSATPTTTRRRRRTRSWVPGGPSRRHRRDRAAPWSIGRPPHLDLPVGLVGDPDRAPEGTLARRRRARSRSRCGSRSWPVSRSPGS